MCGPLCLWPDLVWLLCDEVAESGMGGVWVVG